MIIKTLILILLVVKLVMIMFHPSIHGHLITYAQVRSAISAAARGAADLVVDAGEMS